MSCRTLIITSGSSKIDTSVTKIVTKKVEIKEEKEEGEGNSILSQCSAEINETRQ